MIKQPLNVNLAELYAEAAEKLECNSDDLHMTSWVETFADSGGPHDGGITLKAFRQFQVFGFDVAYKSVGVMYCDGVWREWRGVDECWHTYGEGFV